MCTLCLEYIVCPSRVKYRIFTYSIFTYAQVSNSWAHGFELLFFNIIMTVHQQYSRQWRDDGYTLIRNFPWTICCHVHLSQRRFFDRISTILIIEYVFSETVDREIITRGESCEARDWKFIPSPQTFNVISRSTWRSSAQDLVILSSKLEVH